MKHILLQGAILPDLRDLGISEDNPIYRGVYGFKSMLLVYPFIGVYTFVNLMQSKARQQIGNDVDLIRYGMRAGFRQWLPLAVGAAIFYGSEIAFRPLVYRLLDIEPSMTNRTSQSNPTQSTAASSDTMPNLSAWQKVRHAVGIPEQTNDRETKSNALIVGGAWEESDEENDISFSHPENDERFSTEEPNDKRQHGDTTAQPTIQVDRYYPPIMASQVTAGFTAAALTSLPFIKQIGGPLRCIGLGFIGAIGATLVPSYEQVMAQKTK